MFLVPPTLTAWASSGCLLRSGREDASVVDDRVARVDAGPDVFRRPNVPPHRLDTPLESTCFFVVAPVGNVEGDDRMPFGEQTHNPFLPKPTERTSHQNLHCLPLNRLHRPPIYLPPTQA